MTSDCVLMIADDYKLLRLSRIALRRAGYMVISISDVELAIYMLRTAYYDAVVADLETLKRAGSNKLSLLLHQARDTPVVLGAQRKGQLSDLVDLSDSEALLQRVREALSERRTAYDRADDDDLQEDANTLIFSHLLSGIHHKEPTKPRVHISHQPSAISHQPSATNN